MEQGNWLAAEHDTTVDQQTQDHIDLWHLTGPTTREHILRFIRWAINAKLIAWDGVSFYLDAPAGRMHLRHGGVSLMPNWIGRGA